jgi:hypothetical protein
MSSNLKLARRALGTEDDRARDEVLNLRRTESSIGQNLHAVLTEPRRTAVDLCALTSDPQRHRPGID